MYTLVCRGCGSEYHGGQVPNLLVRVKCNRCLGEIFYDRSTPKAPKIWQGLALSSAYIKQPKFLYLLSEEHQSNWANGEGTVPLGLASSYKSNERQGTQTPDETKIHMGTPNREKLIPFFGEQFQNCTITDSSIFGQHISMASGSIYTEDGRVLCFSDVKSADVCRKLDKNFCVQIDDIAALKLAIDKEVGIVSSLGRCAYTDSIVDRHHFLKFKDDAWMKEFRLFWDTTRELNFTIPKGIARRVSLE